MCELQNLKTINTRLSVRNGTMSDRNLKKAVDEDGLGCIDFVVFELRDHLS